MKAAEIFDQIVNEFQPDRAGSLRAKFQFHLTGNDGGDWVVAVANRECTVNQGAIDKPDVTIGMDAADFVKMVNGDLQPVVAFMQGKIKLQGDMNLAMKVQELFSGAPQK